MWSAARDILEHFLEIFLIIVTFSSAFPIDYILRIGEGLMLDGLIVIVLY